MDWKFAGAAAVTIVIFAVAYIYIGNSLGFGSQDDSAAPIAFGIPLETPTPLPTPIPVFSGVVNPGGESPYVSDVPPTADCADGQDIRRRCMGGNLYHVVCRSGVWGTEVVQNSPDCT